MVKNKKSVGYITEVEYCEGRDTHCGIMEGMYAGR